jgi:hypothetical protein
MADAPPVPVDPAADPAAIAAAVAAPQQGPPVGNLFQTYDPGSTSDLFAPAYIHGYKPSTDAVSAWMAANRGMTRADVDATRIAQPWTDPSKTLGGDGVYGGPIQANQVYGDSRGMVDPEALKVWSQGGHYDMNARRNAIAQRLADNAAAAGAAPPPAPPDPTKGMRFIFD